jgi:GNAT superfamily N-acetyltransferase
MDLRLATSADADAVLAFIERHGFSPRSRATWDGLAMGAMTAWDGGTLVGAVPFEPREIWTSSAGDRVLALHETCVAVDESHRGAGLGSKLQAALADARPLGARLLTVCREEPTSPAYRWYVRCGFAAAVHVESWFLDDPATLAKRAGAFELKPQDVAAVDVPPRAARPGHVARGFVPWLGVHPYGRRYRFHWLRAGAGVMLLGVGALHSSTPRADVLYHDGDLATLLPAAAAACVRDGWTPLRLPCARGAVDASLLRGFDSRWSFDVLARAIDPSLALDTSAWTYAGVDFA